MDKPMVWPYGSIGTEAARSSSIANVDGGEGGADKPKSKITTSKKKDNSSTSQPLTEDTGSPAASPPATGITSRSRSFSSSFQRIFATSSAQSPVPNISLPSTPRPFFNQSPRQDDEDGFQDAAKSHRDRTNSRSGSFSLADSLSSRAVVTASAGSAASPASGGAADPLAGLHETLRDLAKKRGKKEKLKSRPEQVDVLDKASTNKLVKFWQASGVGASYEPEFKQKRRDKVRSKDSGQPGLHRLPGISEQPDDSDTKVRRWQSIMDNSRLSVPPAFEGPHRQRQIQDAKDMYQTVVRNAERSNTAVPPYDFIELIGKGSFGRVYKCREQKTGELVAVKIINIDDTDFEEHVLEKDNALASFRKEVGILQQLKDSNAKNINMIHDAFDLHNQLWIVSDYCTGGSLRTLSRANAGKGFEERYIIPIARELALAIKSVHDIGVIHRDIKCANVYVTEEGDIQLGDFGIVGEVEDGTASKRRTIIGTPHYQPLELQAKTLLTAEAYGKEVDIWSYGCTIFEAATGQPPYAHVPREHVHRELKKPPRLEGGDYSNGLRDFVAFCLNSDPKERPSADDVLDHPYISNTAKRYPTSSLATLIDRYAAWEYKGGQRISLWMAGGAAAPVNSAELENANLGDDDLDWNFSTSDNFNAAFGKRYSHMINIQDFAAAQLGTPEGSGLPPINTKDLSAYQRLEQAHREMSANRGERSLDRLFDANKSPYELHTPLEDDEPVSDLPFRNMGTGAPRESLIDLDMGGGLDKAPVFNFELSDLATIKARTSRPIAIPDDDEEEEEEYRPSGIDDKRATMEWKFPSAEDRKRATMEWTFSTAEPSEPDDPDVSMNLPPTGMAGLPHGFRPTLKHSTTAPIGQLGDFAHLEETVKPSSATVPTTIQRSSPPVRDSVRSMIDLDLGGLDDPANIIRPRTATSISSAAGSTFTDMTSGNPFDLEEDPEQNEIDRNRFSYHKQWRSDGGRMKRSSHKTMQMHSRGSSLMSTDSELDHMREGNNVFEYNYNPIRDKDSSRPQLLSGAPQIDTTSWPDFGPGSGLDEPPTYPRATFRNRKPNGSDSSGAGRGNHANGLSTGSIATSATRGGSQRDLPFPDAVPPREELMYDGANPSLMMSELDRLLDDVTHAFKATTKAFKQQTGYSENDQAADAVVSGSETDSGVESSAAPTGDEEGFA
ncbi:putative protein kinase superfamily protein [Teratosphaeria destructans]|uniref:non-specific serine/threonine protein kinase n=1 Tax=Teratosphaeria destructans TaxID=418781 RepID=A0A9W7SJ87_9PEZI|nr:putative protein kinase superfamily protein [Teratosphaeria destructans]